MPDPWANALAGPTGAAALAAVPAALLLVTVRRWRHIADDERRWLVVLATALLAAAVPRVLFHLAAAPFGWPAALWSPPLDRLAAAIGLAGLGLLAEAGRARALSVGLLLATLAFALGWLAWLAPGAAATAAPSGASVPWDVALAALAGLVVVALARGKPPAPRWLLGAVAGLAVGSLWDATNAAGAQQAATLGARVAVLAACAIGLGRAALSGRRAGGDRPVDAPDLWAAIAQELRLVAASLAGYQELLREGSTRTAEQDIERHLRAIAAQSHRLEVLVANIGALLQDGRRGAGPDAPAAETVERVVQASVARSEMHFQLKSIRAQAHVAPEVAGASVDAAVSGLVVDNLLLGAVQRSPYGAPLDVRAVVDAIGVAISVDYQDTAAPAAGLVEPGDEPRAHFGLARLLADRHGGATWCGPADQGGRRRMVVRLPERRA